MERRRRAEEAEDRQGMVTTLRCCAGCWPFRAFRAQSMEGRGLEARGKARGTWRRVHPERVLMHQRLFCAAGMCPARST